jgi:predicted nucleic acid-binding protein
MAPFLPRVDRQNQGAAELGRIDQSPPKARAAAAAISSAGTSRTCRARFQRWPFAATALAHGLGVATRNSADFARVPGLRVIAAAG